MGCKRLCFVFVFDSVINIAIFEVVRNSSIELFNPAREFLVKYA